MQTSVGIFRGEEDMNQFDIFPKVNNSPPIVALEICRERMVILILITRKYEFTFLFKIRYNGTMLHNSSYEFEHSYFHGEESIELP